MKKNLSEIICILDRSGSMFPLTQSVINGYNEFIKSQRKVEGDAYVTTVLFDDEYKMLYDHINIQEIPEMTERQYNADGLTMLYDAIGMTMDSVGERLANTPEDERPEHVVFFIMTDGANNYSKKYSKETIKEMIEHQQTVYSWEFIFMGAGIDAKNEASQLGIKTEQSYSVDHSAKGISATFATMDCLASSIRAYDAGRKNFIVDPLQVDCAGVAMGKIELN